MNSFLPPDLYQYIDKYKDLSEIRLHRGRPATLNVKGKNVVTDVICSKDELDRIVEKLCGGSVHSYGECINQGYIPLSDGCRAGLCGSFSGNSVCDITDICIRIPRSVKGVGISLCKLLAKDRKGMLIYSPPGEGKTTLLRDIAATLSSPPYSFRLALIDTRREIYREDLFSSSCADIFSGYPKKEGIEIATRTMSPEFIVCDELGSEEAEAVISSQNCGVPLIATAHADSLDSLLSRRAFSDLHKAGVFSSYVGIKRSEQGFVFTIGNGQRLSENKKA